MFQLIRYDSHGARGVSFYYYINFFLDYLTRGRTLYLLVITYPNFGIPKSSDPIPPELAVHRLERLATTIAAPMAATASTKPKPGPSSSSGLVTVMLLGVVALP